ncbi:MAG: hypothetical protein HQ515_21985, partial [Phycisphaeraceae bacterium]|nr:hypothetical protein [Phycisphaeraceae bacterium]
MSIRLPLVVLCAFCVSHAAESDSPLLDNTADYIIAHWKNEFAVLGPQIKAAQVQYHRGDDPYRNMRVLDRQACILPTDHTPFDVEYRRTLALV